MKIIVAILASFVLALVLGRFTVPALRALKAGQSIREIGPNWHRSKEGTPTMGGVIFILPMILCILLAIPQLIAGDLTLVYLLLFTLIFGAIGFLDDFVKVKFKRNLGLTALQKFLLQLAAAGCFLALLRFNGHLTGDLYIHFVNVTLHLNWIICKKKPI